MKSNDGRVDKQEKFKLEVKCWLKKNHRDYDWLASELGVAPNTVRNWMSTRHIPPRKEAVIKQRYLRDDSSHSGKRGKEIISQYNSYADIDKEIYEVQLSLPCRLSAALCEEARCFGIPVELFMQRIIEYAAVQYMKAHRH